MFQFLIGKVKDTVDCYIGFNRDYTVLFQFLIGKVKLKGMKIQISPKKRKVSIPYREGKASAGNLIGVPDMIVSIPYREGKGKCFGETGGFKCPHVSIPYRESKEMQIKPIQELHSPIVSIPYREGKGQFTYSYDNNFIAGFVSIPYREGKACSNEEAGGYWVVSIPYREGKAVMPSAASTFLQDCGFQFLIGKVKRKASAHVSTLPTSFNSL